MMAYHQRVNQFRSRIDFDDPSTIKPPSLAKSAVLQALEDEERQQSLANKGGGWQRPSRSRQRDVPAAAVPRISRTPCIDRDTVMRINRRPIRHRSCDNFWPPARTPSPFERTGGPSVGESEGLKRVAWPPPAEFGDGEYQQQQQPAQQPQQPYHYPPQQQHPAHQQPLQQNYPPQQQQQQQYYQQPHTQQQQQHQPRERIIPIQRPEPSTQQPQYQPQPTQAFQPLVSAQQQQQQLYQQPEAIPQQHQQQFYHTTAADSQIPFVTTLRKEAPMSQEPTPVYHSEPVAAIYQGGTNMRGDQKWPPADVKKQSELENEERRQLAQQPAFRPRKVQKDYSSFFAKNALNATYPGYRAPPGTQHHS